jgi:uncharacterized membrane protein HdeD (DUF308 family)
MNALDQIFGWLMIAFGVAQSVTNFRIQSSSHLTLALSGTAAAIIVGGFLNVSRARHSDGLTRAFSVIGNLLILVLAVRTLSSRRLIIADSALLASKGCRGTNRGGFRNRKGKRDSQ